MNIQVANKLHQLRKQHNLSQEELASKIGISRQAISKWERAETSPDTDNLISLAKLYNVSIDELLNTESYPLPDNEPVSLKKDSYSAGNSVKTSGVNKTIISDDGEIYPNRNVNTNSSANYGSSQKTNTSPYANKTNNQQESDKLKQGIQSIEKGMQNLGINLEAGITHLEKAGKVIGESIDKAGTKIKEEIKKHEEKVSSGAYDNSYKYNYQYQYTPKRKREKNKDKYKFTLFDKLVIMFGILFFAILVPHLEAFAVMFIFLIPTYLTFKTAKYHKDIMYFCYPALVISAFFGISLLGEWTFEYTWTLFLTIPLYYTGIMAFRKKNPLIFCYPVLVAYIFCLCLVLFGDFFAGLLWPIFLTIPFYYVICSHIMKERKEKGKY